MSSLQEIILTLPSGAFFKDDFSGNDLSQDWTITVDDDHDYSVANSYLKIIADTTAGETELISDNTFTPPFRVGFLLSVSQRIANQEIKFGIRNTNAGDSANIVWDGLDSTKTKIFCSRANLSSNQSNIAVPNTSDFTNPVLVEIDCLATEVRFSFRTIDKTVNTLSDNAVFVIQKNTPSANLEYQIFLEVINSNTTVSATEVRIDSIYTARYDQATSASVGGLTDTQLRASPISVTSTVLLNSGTAPTGVTGPTTGTGTYRWLGGIWDLLGVIRDLLTNRLPNTQLSPSFITAISSGTIAAGYRSISFVNAGTNPGLLLGTSFPPGAVISYAAPGGQTLAAFAYDATGTTFLIAALNT
jgi:hypothetical protein